jgi:adenosylmethionine-8-amino-7-oxononanoate aminotransferase
MLLTLAVPVLDLGVSTTRVRSHTFIAQQFVGNNVHGLTYGGAHVKCKAFNKLVKIWSKTCIKYK